MQISYAGRLRRRRRGPSRSRAPCAGERSHLAPVCAFRAPRSPAPRLGRAEQSLTRSPKCTPDDTIGDLKKLIAAQTGTRPEKIKLQKWYTVFKDHITLEDCE